MRKPYGFAFGALLALTVIVTTAQVSGFPSRPRFFSVGVNTVAPSNAGEMTLQSNVDAARTFAVDNDSNGASNLARATITSGDASLSVFTAGSGRASSTVTNGPTGAQAGMRTLGAHPIIFGTNNTLALTIESDQDLATPGRITSTAAGGFLNDHTAPRFCWNENDAAADELGWTIIALGGDFSMYANPDSNPCTSVSSTRFFRVQRTAAVVDAIDLAATAVTVNSNPIESTIICTTACDISGLAVGQSAVIAAAATENLSSDVTMGFTTHFQFTNPPTGRFAVEGCLNITAVDGTQGFQFEFGQSSGSANGTLALNGTANGVAFNGAGGWDITHIAQAAMSTTDNHLCWKGLVDPTGTFGLLWRQNTTDVDAITLSTGRVYFMVKRISA